jgi:hypothetical protein
MLVTYRKIHNKEKRFEHNLRIFSYLIFSRGLWLYIRNTLILIYLLRGV